MNNQRFVPKGKAFWNDHITRFKASGLGQYAYCRREGLARSSLGSHLRKASLQSGPDLKSGFLEISAPSQRSSLTGVIQIQYANVVVTLPQDYPTTELVQILQSFHSC
jgi:hypothetical protein